mgnify:CR=1 FL=1
MINIIKPLKYQPNYCEENIWHLCQHRKYLGGKVIFISSLGNYFPMLCQKGGKEIDQTIFWDYHVILLKEGKIFDFNSTLSFSTPIKDYFEQSFIEDFLLMPHQAPKFRVLDAEEYIRLFLSDRRHMKANSTWISPPPSWPPISETSSNLERFTDMRDLEIGDVLTASQVLERF